MKKVSEIMPFGLRVQPELLAWVREKAVEQERSMNYVIGRIIAAARDAEQAKEVA